MQTESAAWAPSLKRRQEPRMLIGQYTFALLCNPKHGSREANKELPGSLWVSEGSNERAAFPTTVKNGRRKDERVMKRRAAVTCISGLI